MWIQLRNVEIPLYAIYWSALIDCLEFTGSLPILDKEIEFPSMVAEQKL
jgi:hypothetical protein